MLAIKTWQALQHQMLIIKIWQTFQHQVLAIKTWQASSSALDARNQDTANYSASSDCHQDMASSQHQMLAIKASFPIPNWFSFFVQNATQHMSAPALVWL
jgi:hypothetical protein